LLLIYIFQKGHLQLTLYPKRIFLPDTFKEKKFLYVLIKSNWINFTTLSEYNSFHTNQMQSVMIWIVKLFG